MMTVSRNADHGRVKETPQTAKVRLDWHKVGARRRHRFSPFRYTHFVRTGICDAARFHRTAVGRKSDMQHAFEHALGRLKAA
eukprot:55400-Chlamydomonas_euryale.AAC.6